MHHLIVAALQETLNYHRAKTASFRPRQSGKRMSPRAVPQLPHVKKARLIAFSKKRFSPVPSASRRSHGANLVVVAASAIRLSAKNPRV